MNSEPDSVDAILDQMDQGPEAIKAREELHKQQIRAALETSIAKLAALDEISYQAQRKPAAKALDIPVNVLDKLVSKRRPTGSGEAARGTSLDLRPPIPWHQKVDGPDLLSTMVIIIRLHVILQPAAAVAVALWVVFTYLLDCFSHSPRLALTSPAPRCGKTTLIELIARVALKALPASNITPAATFRTIEACMPTLLIDEADSFLRDDEELRGVLNSGHSPAAAFVIRTVGDDHEPRKFSTWCPLAIALVGKLPATLQDRAIEISLKRKTPTEQVERLGSDAYARLDTCARKLTRWAADNRPTLAAAAPAMPAGLDDRAADNWRPLLAIADAAGGQWPMIAREAATMLSATREERSLGILLLSDIRSLFMVHDSDQISSAKLCDELAKMESRPWPEYRRGRPITQKQLAGLLRDFGISPATLGKEAKGYRLKWFQDAFDRYLPPLTPVSPVEVSNSFSANGSDHFFDPSADPASDGSKTPVEHTPPATSTLRHQENGETSMNIELKTSNGTEDIEKI